MPVERLVIDKISGHRSARGRGRIIAVLYETHLKGLLRPSFHLGNANRTSFPLTNTFSNTGAARPCNLDRRTGCTAVCAWVPLNATSPAMRGPFTASRIQLRQSPNVDSLVQWHLPARQCLYLAHGSRSSLVSRKHFRAHSNSWTVYSSLFGRPQTGQARALFCSIYYGTWSRSHDSRGT